MKIAAFGATGRTGQHFLRLALAAGHEATVLVRDPSKLAPLPSIRVVTGDAGDAGPVGDALSGAQCVVSCLGSGDGTLVRFARAVIPIMLEFGPRRVISLVGAGVSTPGDSSTFSRRAMLALMALLSSGMLADANEHASLIRASGLDWTLVRPPRLVSGQPTGKVSSAPDLRLGPVASIARADLAAFMLQQMTSSRYLRQSPMVANEK